MHCKYNLFWLYDLIDEFLEHLIAQLKRIRCRLLSKNASSEEFLNSSSDRG